MTLYGRSELDVPPESEVVEVEKTLALSPKRTCWILVFLWFSLIIWVRVLLCFFTLCLVAQKQKSAFLFQIPTKIVTQAAKVYPPAQKVAITFLFSNSKLNNKVMEWFLLNRNLTQISFSQNKRLLFSLLVLWFDSQASCVWRPLVNGSLILLVGAHGLSCTPSSAENPSGSDVTQGWLWSELGTVMWPSGCFHLLVPLRRDIDFVPKHSTSWTFIHFGSKCQNKQRLWSPDFVCVFL